MKYLVKKVDVAALIDGNESWTITEGNKSRTNATEILKKKIKSKAKKESETRYKEKE